VSDGQEQILDAPLAQPVGGTEKASGESRAERSRLGGYRRRFAVVYLGLALIVGVALGAFVVLVGRPDAAPDPVWSAWEPNGSETARVRQIADHVTQGYRTPEGDQMVVALAGPPSIMGSEGTAPIPIRAIAVRPDTSRGQAEEDDIEIHDASKSMQFILCGLGDACAMAGAPSVARHSLLRREALELALYTFKYIDEVDSVTVLLPPPPGGESPATAVFLRRGDVNGELKVPLRRTMSAGAPPLGKIPATELETLNRITLPRLYNFQYTQTQDLSAVLVLDPAIS